MKESASSQTGETNTALLQSQAGPPRRILVVDDDSDIRRLSAAMLKRSGYEVDAAADGAAGWEALNADRYDLLITDNEMPIMSGIELLRKLRTARVAVPVIMASGRLPISEFDQHPWLQPTATLLKPYSVEEFLGTVKQVLRGTDGACGQIAPPPEWQRRTPAPTLRPG